MNERRRGVRAAHRLPVNNVIVVCLSCGRMAPSKGADANNPFGTFLWHQPCPYCGAENWASHDPNRDLRTGRLLSENEEREGG